MLRPIERVYAPLADHLAARGAAGERRVTLTFAAIEALLGRPLPATARAARQQRQRSIARPGRSRSPAPGARAAVVAGLVWRNLAASGTPPCAAVCRDITRRATLLA